MNLYYITGTSSGLGLAIANLLLEQEDNVIVGISRRIVIQHERYHHISHDLTTPINKEIFEPIDGSYSRIALINNAGDVGHITTVGSQTFEEISDNYLLNLTIPSLLCNYFVEAYKKNTSALRMIVNISSGAGKHPIEAWSTYCASKAALDMFSEVLQLEQPEFKVFSVAPGIVDTAMQQAIRNADKEHFPHLERFMDYKKEGELVSARDVAAKFVHIFDNSELFDTVRFSVRDF
jgi:benzil reductase ((S)-benzoin forming)